MKPKRLIITALVLLLITSTAYYWEALLGIWLIPWTVILFLTFVFLLIGLLYQIFLLLREKFSSRPRIISVAVLVGILGLIIYEPLDFEALEAKDILIASREGAANCTTTYKLKEDNSYVVRSVCFGIDKIKGTYTVEGDTIKFKDATTENIFQFGIIKPGDIGEKGNLGDFTLYRSLNDTIPLRLQIFMNHLTKSPPAGN